LEKRGFREGGSLTMDKALSFYDKMEVYMKNRTEAMVIDNSNLSGEQVLERVLEKIQ